jgi:hypothetical protein
MGKVYYIIMMEKLIMKGIGLIIKEKGMVKKFGKMGNIL